MQVPSPFLPTASADAAPQPEALMLALDPLDAMSPVQALRDAGYWVRLASSVDQALEALAAPGARYAVLAADLTEAPPACAARLVQGARRTFPAIHLVCFQNDEAGAAPEGALVCACDRDSLLALMLDLRARDARGACATA